MKVHKSTPHSSSLEAVQSELENERQVKIVPLVSAAAPSTPSSEDTR